MNSRREIWKQKHGEIPKGWISINLNGQPSDNRVENIAVIPRSSSLRLIVSPFVARIRKLERELVALEKTIEGENK
jgi:hypothetical protein